MRMKKILTYYKYPSIYTELNTIATTPVSPLIGSVSAGLKSMAGQRLHSKSWSCWIFNQRFHFSSKVQKDVSSLL